MKKLRYTVQILIIAIVLLSPIPAYADIIWTPPDSFFDKNYDKCEQLNRSFYANGASGYVSVKKEPGSDIEVFTITNGELYDVSFTYELDDEQWGIIMRDVQDDFSNPRTGWLPINQMVAAYDYISFLDEHMGEVYSYRGDYASLYEPVDLVFWTWPGSGNISRVLETKYTQYREDILKTGALILYGYVDSEGREWGMVSRYAKYDENTWICLSDPANQDIPAFNKAPQPELIPPSDPNKQSTTLSILSNNWKIILLVVVLVIGTDALIRVVNKNKK